MNASPTKTTPRRALSNPAKTRQWNETSFGSFFTGRLSLNKSAKAGRRNNALAVLFYAGFLNLLVPWATQAEIKYKLTEIQGLRSPNTMPKAINNGGRVVGRYAWVGGSSHAFTYRNGVLNNLFTMSGYKYNLVNAINNYGLIVGFFATDTDSRGYLRATDGQITDLGALTPQDINDFGVIVGDNGIGKAAIYQGGQLSTLGSFAGRPLVQATAVNNGGQILALYQTADNTAGAFRTVIWTLAESREIVPPSIGDELVGLAINDHGAVAGYINPPATGGSHGFIYSGGTVHDLGTFAYYSAINNSGQAVGSGYNQDTGQNYAAFTDGVQVLDLNTLIDPISGAHLGNATGINDSGQICASGVNASGISVGFLLTPIK
jgi:probable HAF family extracellular repeat protein